MSEPIPRELADAFLEIVRIYRDDWTPSIPEREVPIKGMFFSMSAVCRFVSEFGDALPDSVFHELLSCMHAADMDLQADLGRTRTYSTAARCLLKLIERAKARSRASL